MQTEPITAWSQFLTSFGPLFGVIVGAIATYFTQNNALKKQWEMEGDKKKEEKNIEKLEIYSEILKLDGENSMLQHVGGGYNDFDIDAYNEKFRPVFFSKFYLLDQKITDAIRGMDYNIAAGNYFEELEQHHIDELIDLYKAIINDIEEYIRRS